MPPQRNNRRPKRLIGAASAATGTRPSGDSGQAPTVTGPPNEATHVATNPLAEILDRLDRMEARIGLQPSQPVQLTVPSDSFDWRPACGQFPVGGTMGGPACGQAPAAVLSPAVLLSSSPVTTYSK